MRRRDVVLRSQMQKEIPQKGYLFAAWLWSLKKREMLYNEYALRDDVVAAGDRRRQFFVFAFCLLHPDT